MRIRNMGYLNNVGKHVYVSILFFKIRWLYNNNVCTILTCYIYSTRKHSKLRFIYCYSYLPWIFFRLKYSLGIIYLKTIEQCKYASQWTHIYMWRTSRYRVMRIWVTDGEKFTKISSEWWQDRFNTSVHNTIAKVYLSFCWKKHKGTVFHCSFKKISL